MLGINIVIVNFKTTKDFLIIVSFLLNINVSLFYVYFNPNKNAVSINKIIMIFNLFFLGISGYLQYENSVLMWGGKAFRNIDYLRSNTIIILITLLYQNIYKNIYKIKTGNNRKEKKNHAKYSIVNILLISIMSSFIILSVYNFDLSELMFRSGKSNINNHSIKLIFNTFLRPIPVMALLIFKISKEKNRKAEIVLILLMLITNFPTALARYYTAAIYLPFLFIYLPILEKRTHLFTVTFVVLLLILFPMLNEFRYAESVKDIKLSFNFDMFYQGHFDNYQMFTRVISEKYITNGNQLLGSLLFFIPRSIWPSKPIGSGSLVSELSNLSFDNISMNYFGEGYINFGYLGIVLFVVILVFVSVYYDKNKNKKSVLFKSRYYIILGMMFFIMRGDLLSSLSFLIGMLLSLSLVSKLSKKRSVINGYKYCNKKDTRRTT